MSSSLLGTQEAAWENFISYWSMKSKPWHLLCAACLSHMCFPVSTALTISGALTSATIEMSSSRLGTQEAALKNFISYWSMKSTEKGPSSSPREPSEREPRWPPLALRLKLCANQHVSTREGGDVPATKPSSDVLHSVLLPKINLHSSDVLHSVLLPKINLHYRSRDNQLRATALK